MNLPRQTYLGAEGLKKYLAPNNDRYIPVVELPSLLNPYLEPYDIHISLKLMNTLPLGNVKSLPAYSLLQSHDITEKKIIESSSGNTVFSMGILAPHMGAESVSAIASNDVSANKLKLLQLANVQVQLVDGPICPDADDPHGSIAMAKVRGEQDGWINPGQYSNEANPAAHESITGPQLYNQLGDEISMLVAGLGTTGTLVGTARYLRQRLPDMKVAGAVRVPNNHIPGVRTQQGLSEVAFNWEEYLTEPPVMVNEHDAYATSLAMIRAGLLVGPSAGFALYAAKHLIRQYIDQGGAAALRGKHVVVVCPDSCFPYVDEYFEVLGNSYFPEVEDTTTRPPEEASQLLATIPEIAVEELHADMHEGRMQHYEVIDVRELQEFEDHHIPGSTQVGFHNIANWLSSLSPLAKQKRYVFVCSRIQRSARAAYVAQQSGVSAYVLTGGTAAWSAAGFERVQPQSCVIKHPWK